MTPDAPVATTGLAVLVLFGHGVATVLLGWGYFRRFRVARPPIGVMNLADVAIMVASIVVVPYLYLALPTWVVGALLGLGALSVVLVVVEPIVRAGWASWVAVGVLGVADLWVLLAFGPGSRAFLAVNNGLMVIVVVGIANLWAQSGMKARDAAVLAGALTIYDVMFTTQLPLMTELFSRLADLPFAPMVAWPVGEDGRWLGIGVGDLLLATVFPPVARKSFHLAAGITALLIALVTLLVVVALPDRFLGWDTFPVMVMLGPLMVAQYLWWARRLGRERTTLEYLRAEPLPS